MFKEVAVICDECNGVVVLGSHDFSRFSNLTQILGSVGWVKVLTKKTNVNTGEEWLIKEEHFCKSCQD